jgi:hypothetical protein
VTSELSRSSIGYPRSPTHEKRPTVPTKTLYSRTMIGEYTEDHLLGVAKSVVEKKTKHSIVLDVKAEARIPKFESQGANTVRVQFLCR